MTASQERLYFLLQLTAHRLKKRADNILIESGGLTASQAAVMAVIAKEPPVTQRYIAEKLSQRESAITAMTDRLLKARYITRARSESDGRAWALMPTAEGRTALNHMGGAFQNINDLLEQNLDSGEIGRLAADLKKILHAMDGKADM